MKTLKYEIFIGLNKKNYATFDEDFVKNEFIKFFTNYKVDFSMNRQVGGYVHEDGTYVIEPGFKLTFIGSRNGEREFVNNLKKYFEQESVLVIKREIKSEFYKE